MTTDPKPSEVERTLADAATAYARLSAIQYQGMGDWREPNGNSLDAEDLAEIKSDVAAAYPLQAAEITDLQAQLAAMAVKLQAAEAEVQNWKDKAEFTKNRFCCVYCNKVSEKFETFENACEAVKLHAIHCEHHPVNELLTKYKPLFERYDHLEKIEAKLAAFEDATKLTPSAFAVNGFSNIGISEGGMMARQLSSGRKLIVINFSVGYRVYIDSVSDGFVCTLSTIGQLAHLLAAFEVRP